MSTSKIYTEYSEQLYRFILSRVKDETTSKDLLQEVFVKVHIKIDSLQKKEKLQSWLFSLTSNTINDYFRKQKKQVPTQEEIQSSEVSDTHVAQDCLIPLIKKLPDTYKEAVFLSEIKGMKQAAVAEKLGISISGAKSRIQRGRTLLKEGYINCCDYKVNENGFLVGEHKDQSECKVCN